MPEGIITHDVIIVGAGPAGCLAAYELAKAGKKVLLLEKEKLPRYKTCGGGIPKSVLSWLDIDISSAIEREISSVKYTYNLKHPVEAKVETPIVLMVMRDKFDYLLAQTAVKAGAELIDGMPLASIEFSGEVIEAGAGKHSWRSKYLIGADGALSITARRLELKSQRNLGVGLEVELPSSNKELFSRAEFGFGLVKSGYAWSFPKKDLLSIGIGTFKLGEKALKEKLFRWLEYLGCTHFSENIHGHPLPYFEKERNLVKGNIMLVGDAASLMNPLSGEGISYAMRSGKFAAEAIINGNPALYQKRIKEEIYPELKISLQLARFFYAFPKFSYEQAVKNPRVTELFARLLAGEISYREIWEKAKKKLIKPL